MTRRVPERRKMHSVNLIGGKSSAKDTLYGMPHGDKISSDWPTNDEIDECEKMGYCPSVFTLQPGQMVHINKGRVHAFRKMSPAPLPETDCHHDLRKKLVTTIRKPSRFICISVAWDWMYKGISSEGINREVSSVLECARLNSSHRLQSLAIPEATLLQMAKESISKFQLQQTSDDTCSPSFLVHSLQSSNRKQDTCLPDPKTILRGILPSLQFVVNKHVSAARASEGWRAGEGSHEKLDIKRKPNARENPDVFALDPYGSSDFFCKICMEELSNVYLHCWGCEELLAKDFNICVNCHSGGQFRSYFQMHPFDEKRRAELNHTGDMQFDRTVKCPCHNGRKCTHCGYCTGCSCKCHQRFELNFRFMGVEDEVKLLREAETIVGLDEIPHALETKARLFSLVDDIVMEQPSNSNGNSSNATGLTASSETVVGLNSGPVPGTTEDLLEEISPDKKVPARKVSDPEKTNQTLINPHAELADSHEPEGAASCFSNIVDSGFGAFVNSVSLVDNGPRFLHANTARFALNKEGVPCSIDSAGANELAEDESLRHSEAVSALFLFRNNSIPRRNSEEESIAEGNDLIRTDPDHPSSKHDNATHALLAESSGDAKFATGGGDNDISESACVERSIMDCGKSSESSKLTKLEGIESGDTSRAEEGNAEIPIDGSGPFTDDETHADDGIDAPLDKRSYQKAANDNGAPTSILDAQTEWNNATSLGDGRNSVTCIEESNLRTDTDRPGDSQTKEGEPSSNESKQSENNTFPSDKDSSPSSLPLDVTTVQNDEHDNDVNDGSNHAKPIRPENEDGAKKQGIILQSNRKKKKPLRTSSLRKTTSESTLSSLPFKTTAHSQEEDTSKNRREERISKNPNDEGLAEIDEGIDAAEPSGHRDLPVGSTIVVEAKSKLYQAKILGYHKKDKNRLKINYAGTKSHRWEYIHTNKVKKIISIGKDQETKQKKKPRRHSSPPESDDSTISKFDSVDWDARCSSLVYSNTTPREPFSRYDLSPGAIAFTAPRGDLEECTAASNVDGMTQNDLEDFIATARSIGNPSVKDLLRLLKRGTRLNKKNVIHLYRNFADCKIRGPESNRKQMDVFYTRREIDIMNYLVSTKRGVKEAADLIPYRPTGNLEAIMEKVRKEGSWRDDRYCNLLDSTVEKIWELERR